MDKKVKNKGAKSTNIQVTRNNKGSAGTNIQVTRNIGVRKVKTRR